MNQRIRSRLEEVLGPVKTLSPVGGGCINDAYRATLASGDTAFVKTHPDPPPGFFRAEAQGLSWLTVEGGPRIPDVRAVEEDLLVLEDLGTGRPTKSYQRLLGRSLALMHQTAAPAFGLAEPNFLATIPQENDAAPSWATFYRERRLRPQVERALERGAPPHWVGQFETLFARLEDLVGPDEPPARLHGDLWSGNVHTDEHGAPCLVDPAVYGGHREIDLAMLALFGTVSTELLAAYEEVLPLAPGWQDRQALYQLYPLLTHVVLFGSSYVAQTEQALVRYL